MFNTLARLLFVEDEMLIQALVERAPSDAGFIVASATNAEAAFDLLCQGPFDFCALVTDINLGPGLSGWEVAKLAGRLVTDIPVVYASGGSAQEFDARSVDHGVLVNKPYAPAQIVSAVALLLTEVHGQA